MRRVMLVVSAVSALLLGALAAATLGATATAHAAPSTPSPNNNSQGSAGEMVCTLSDSRLLELSGLVALDNGYAAINDSNENLSAMRISYLDKNCKLLRSVAYPGGARDPEDLAIAPDGTLWVADIGDNPDSPSRRSTIALWKLAPNSSTPVIHRLSYPDGPHDAEALLLGKDGAPIIVTKELIGPAKVYVPTGALQPNTTAGVKLRLAGEFKPENTGTATKFGIAGRNAVTGGANSADGKKVALRTYSDAYEWDVPDGDVVKAITTAKPRLTPLPDEPQGESIAYTRDGKSFLTVSDNTEGESAILRYTPKTAAAQPAASGKAAATDAAGESEHWYDLTPLERTTALIAGVGVLGLLMVVIGVLAIRKSRLARRAAARAARAAAAAPARGSARVNADDVDNPPGVYGSPRSSYDAERGYDDGEDAYSGGYGPASHGSGGHASSGRRHGYDDDEPEYQGPGYGGPGYGGPGYGGPGYGQAYPPATYGGRDRPDYPEYGGHGQSYSSRR